MLIRPINCVVQYVATLNESLKALSSKKLTSRQCIWLTIILMGLIVTNSLNWAAFERRSLGQYKQSSLRWLFYRAKITWERLLQASILHILSHYEITQGVLVLDDSDKMRSRNTSKIAGVHKIKDKKTGGYFEGQEFVFLLLVTEKITIPVGFQFYTPNPELTAWKKQIKLEKKAGIIAKHRTKAPGFNANYPSKLMIGLDLLQIFSDNHPRTKIQAILADALYGSQVFMDEAARVTGCDQVISQLKKNQLVRYCGQRLSLTTYFNRTQGLEHDLIVRGNQTKKVTVIAARLWIASHKKKRFVVALKYEGETDYRFIVARDLSWRHQDILRTYTLRWLVEVFIADWKGHGGWNTLSKQQGAESATQGVILSLLCDHLLILHPSQAALIKNKQPAMSVGCLVERINAEALIDGIHQIIHSNHPKQQFNLFIHALEQAIPQQPSTKHLIGRNLGRIEPTHSLRYRKAA